MYVPAVTPLTFSMLVVLPESVALPPDILLQLRETIVPSLSAAVAVKEAELTGSLMDRSAPASTNGD